MIVEDPVFLTLGEVIEIHRDQIERVLVWQQRKRKVGVSEFQFHDGSMKAVLPAVSHSAAVR